MCVKNMKSVKVTERFWWVGLSRSFFTARIFWNDESSPKAKIYTAKFKYDSPFDFSRLCLCFEFGFENWWCWKSTMRPVFLYFEFIWSFLRLSQRFSDFKHFVFIISFFIFILKKKPTKIFISWVFCPDVRLKNIPGLKIIDFSANFSTLTKFFNLAKGEPTIGHYCQFFGISIIERQIYCRGTLNSSELFFWPG